MIMTATLKAQLAVELFNSYDSFKARDIASRRFTQTDLFQWLKPFEEQKLFQKSEVGKSAEGRTIYLLTLGTGTTKVLLWSQMHGDEPTATMALVDMLSFMSRNPGHPAVREALRIAKESGALEAARAESGSERPREDPVHPPRLAQRKPVSPERG